MLRVERNILSEESQNQSIENQVIVQGHRIEAAGAAPVPAITNANKQLRWKMISSPETAHNQLRGQKYGWLATKALLSMQTPPRNKDQQTLWAQNAKWGSKGKFPRIQAWLGILWRCCHMWEIQHEIATAAAFPRAGHSLSDSMRTAEVSRKISPCTWTAPGDFYIRVATFALQLHLGTRTRRSQNQICAMARLQSC